MVAREREKERDEGKANQQCGPVRTHKGSESYMGPVLWHPPKQLHVVIFQRSLVSDHQTNIIIVRKIETFEMPQHTKTQTEQFCWENTTDQFCARVAISFNL